MSEDQDDSQKTEEPTQRKIDQSREKGQVANSKEVAHFSILFAAALLIVFFTPFFLGAMVEILAPFLEKPHDIPVNADSIRSVLAKTLLQVGGAMIILALAMILAALASNFLQNGILLSAEPLKPKLEKISPIKGLKRLFSLKSLVEFLKGIFKIAIVGTVCFVLVRPALKDTPLYIDISLTALLLQIQQLVLLLFVGVLSVMFLIMMLDVFYQRMEHRKQLRMSRQELKDEYKQTEGDPHVKAKLRQVRQERAKRRMMAAVPEASVVLTNPTHYAVALKYEHLSTQAPVVVAKGVDSLALRIREVAIEHDIPVVENPPLTRLLYKEVDIDAEISFEHYKAVAEIIGYVLRLQQKKK